jgi:histidine ammonia-lyase
MGANAATKAYRVLNNLRRILAIELLNAAQALEFRRPLKSSPSVEYLHAQLRLHVAKTEDDRYFSSDLRKVESILQTIL